MKPRSVHFFTCEHNPAAAISIAQLITSFRFFFYLPYFFEYFAALSVASRACFKSLSDNYKNPISCLTDADFLIKVGVSGRMWENLVGLDEFSVI
ncbi:hypothetical protein [Nitrosomonas sp. sh817]|uniref:hypothetical protein n=1 Tax=Nitrosomonas sp. sh817 TaxID=3070658 RepID=UPI0027DBC43B|nr:hypothetical protein [Nitrosomonas sp. sh817]WMJ08723.1 hypothetical protein RBH92_00505 [Nitrosomonas sp. sh817]